MKKVLFLLLLLPFLGANAQLKKQLENNNWSGGGYAELNEDGHVRKDFHATGYRGMAYFTRDPESENKGFMTIHGVQASERLFFGLGFGVTVADGDRYDEKRVPVFADLRYGFNNRRWTPYLDFQLGGSINSASGSTIKAKNGLYFSPSFGLTFGLNRHFAIDVAIAYVLNGGGYRVSGQGYSYGDEQYISYNMVNSSVAQYQYIENIYGTSTSQTVYRHSCEFRIGVQF